MLKIETMELFDVYGKLLTENQQEIVKMYFGYDLTLSEIAETKGVSRQSVSECINKSKKQLEEWEEKLGFLKLQNALREKQERLKAELRDWAEKADLPEKEKNGFSAILDKEF